MACVKPDAVVEDMIEAGRAKGQLPVSAMLIRGALSGMLLGVMGMMMGARVSLSQWWLWNQIPVTLGNIVGGALFTGLALYWTHRSRVPQATSQAAITCLAGQPETAVG